MICAEGALRTVGEVEMLTGIPRRRVKYCIERGILHPCGRSEGGYWLYNSDDIERLRIVWLYKELDYPDSALKDMLSNPDFSALAELNRQIETLAGKQKLCEKKICAARLVREWLTREESPDYEVMCREVRAIIDGESLEIRSVSE